MKKSNKFLLGAILTGILVLAGIHIALSAKYNSGSFTAYNELESDKSMEARALTNIHQIQLENIGYVTVRYDATPSMKYTKGVKSVAITEQGGVLKLTMPKAEDGKGSRDLSVHLYVDSSMLVSLVNSRAYLVNNGEPKSRLNMTINDSYLTTSDDVNTENFFLGSLNLTAANRSEVRLNGINIGQLALNLQYSTFVEDQSTFQNIQLQADDSSRVSLMSAHLLKVNQNKQQ
jgi:hypothetical protein